MAKCLKCSEEVRYTAEFCGHCGAKQPWADAEIKLKLVNEEYKNKEDKAKRSTYKIIIISLGIIIVFYLIKNVIGGHIRKTYTEKVKEAIKSEGFKGVSGEQKRPQLDEIKEKAALLSGKSTEELIETYPSKTYYFDFDGDGKNDTFSVTCKKVSENSTNIEFVYKHIWYKFDIELKSTNGKLLWKEIYYSNEKDFNDIFERFGIKNSGAAEYVKKYFEVVSSYGKEVYINEYGKRAIERKEIRKEWIGDAVRENQADVTVDEVIDELVKGERLIIDYRAVWAEDIRIITYSRVLNATVQLLSGFDGYEE